MKVWIINQYALPPDEPGITRHYSLAKELMKFGHEVFIIASSFHHSTGREIRLAKREWVRLQIEQGVPFLWLRTPPYRGNGAARMWNMLTFGIRAIRRAKEYLAKPDVVLGSSPHLFAALAAERLARYWGVPFVLEVRDLWPQALIDLGGISPTHPLVRIMERIERHLYKRAARIITLLPGAIDYIAEKAVSRGKVAWIPNGIDLTLVPPPVPPRRRTRMTLMYAGAHGLANGLDLVLHAARILEEDGWGQRVVFRLVGDGPEKPHLIRLANQLELRNVLFEDPVPKREIYGKLMEADAFVMVLRDSPLFRWGISPNKLFDFMACARPVIFRVSSPYNPVEEARAGLTVRDASPEALARAIRSLSEMQLEDRWRMGLRGRQYVEKNYSVNNLARRLEEVLLDAVK